MLSQSIWWSSIALEILLLVRGLLARVASRYPAFYFYVSFVLLQDLLSFLVYRWYPPQIYRSVYWTTEFLGVLIGCGIVFEIYRVGLAAYPGAARMARNVLAIVFSTALAKGLADAANDPRWWLEATARDVEIVLRTVQAISLIALVALFLFYSIPFGKNLRGILVGYGLFVSASVVSMNFAPVGVRTFSDFWVYLFPASYLITLSVWTAHLWSYRAIPVPKETVRIEQEYQRLAAATHRRLQEARGYLAKAVRP